MLIGFALAARLPVAVSIILAIALELVVGYMIRTISHSISSC